MQLQDDDPWIRGSCLCGMIKYSIVKRPTNLSRFICHCVLCKKASGSAFMTNWWMDENAVSLTTGKDVIKSVVITTTKTGFHVTRSFCSACGSPLFLSSSNPQVAGRTGVTAGTIDFDKDLEPDSNIALSWKPDGEVFVEDRVLCLSQLADVPQYDSRLGKV